MSRREMTVWVTWFAASLAIQACEAKPDDNSNNGQQPAKPAAEVGAGAANTAKAPDGSKSLVFPGAGSSMVMAKAPSIDVTKPYGYHLEPILQKINATNDQRVKIIAVVESYKSKIQPLRDEYKGKRQEFIAVMTGGGAAETIMAKQMELSHLASDITSKYTLMRLEIRRLLTPQQILQFEDYARQHGWNSH